MIASKTCVTPPVGSGRAGTNISSMIVTAKLFSANTLPMPPSVFGSSLRSQLSSWSLNGALVLTASSRRRRRSREPVSGKVFGAGGVAWAWSA